MLTVRETLRALQMERAIKVVTAVSDPPVLTPADLARIQHESDRLHAAFLARTASMEILTADDLRVRIQWHEWHDTMSAYASGLFL